MSDTLWWPAYVGLGSNLDDPPARVRGAFDALARLEGTRLVLRSGLYRSPPMGPADQPDYVNAAAGLLTRLAPQALLQRLQDVERANGRVRDAGRRWGPRTLDLDLLVYGDRRIDEPSLVLPHAGIAERAFVLLPLLELAPGLVVPGRGSVARLAAALADAAGVTRVEDA